MIGLLLGLLGTCSSFILLILDNKNQPASAKKIIYSVAAVGFLTFLGQQYASYVSSEASSQVIKTIKENTEDTNAKVSALQIILNKVETIGIDKFGVEIFSVSKNHLTPFDKGSISQWNEYARSISNSSEQTALNIYLSDDKNYSTSLLLAYLITNQENRSSLKEKLYDFQPIYFNDFLNDYKGELACDFVLFMNNEQKVLFYARSQDFINELIVQVQIGNIDSSKTISGNDLSKFSSVNHSVNGQNTRGQGYFILKRAIIC